ncbi:hypothetical protein QA646_22925 (plasmid) [Rhizobium sp. CB3090]|uniref:hypothetical protein n=1 Tax=Rhizobium sp. CB3090 TaxID=3039156 RepID=UPI0024B11A3A|nr:hypothetical protein [Rhizobium sp. CB3090]WFU11260.1 hypothetical protein QA646_22925 [Rhizobium sp. CB3090]
MRFISTGIFLGVLAGAVPLSHKAHAGDLVIWSPVKVAPRTYQTTIGFRLPMAWEMSAGADIGLGGAAGGTILTGSELATLWGRMVEDRRNFAGNSRREVAVRVDALRGSGMMYLGRSRNWIFSKDIDMQMVRSLNVSYATTQTASTSITASQAVTMIFPWTGTSISARGEVNDTKDAFSSRFAFNQAIAPNLSLTASLTDPLTLTPAGNVRVDYRIKW